MSSKFLKISVKERTFLFDFSRRGLCPDSLELLFNMIC